MGKTKNEKIENGISRRSFVSGAALGTAGLMAASVLTGCNAKEAGATVPTKYIPSEPETWDEEHEFVVCGCGIGGGCAMIEAHDLGVDVIGIEKSPSIRNYAACTWSGGALCGLGTKTQKDNGITEDSVDQFIRDVHVAGDELGETAIIRTWGELSGETIEWLVHRCGVEIMPGLRLSTEHTYRRSHNSVPYNCGYGWMVGVENTLADLKIPILMETAVTRIHRAASGRVVGVECKDLKTGQVKNIKGTKGVLLAMGGYGNNNDIWMYYSPIMKDVLAKAKKAGGVYPPHILGDGYHMMDDLDVYQYPGQSLYGCGGTALDDRGSSDAGLLPYRWANTHGSIWLNQEGKRWGAETFMEYYTARTWRYKTNNFVFYVLFDDTVMQGEIGKTYCAPLMKSCEETGYTKSIHSANTIEEVAKFFEIDAAQAKKTLDDWNALVTSGGVDTEFGRGITTGTSMGPAIVKPPFWIFESTICYGTSKAGGMITTKAEAVDTDRKIIPGLYICGEMASFQAMGSARTHITGGCNSNAANFGRVAARSVAGITKEEATKKAQAKIAAGPTRTPEKIEGDWDRSKYAKEMRAIVATGIYDDITWHMPASVVE